MAPPSWVASPPEQFHIQLPCGAASLPLPFGTGHETEHYNPIFSMSFLEHRVTQQPIKGQKCGGEFNLEKWNAHGAAYLLHDRLHTRSDITLLMFVHFVQACLKQHSSNLKTGQFVRLVGYPLEEFQKRELVLQN
ncbi:hypothetical protein JHK86_035516 [Glycine max]|nr:hypothetical protein JHK86_035516 [Glycine max]